jgi:hypothetical protein
MKRSRLVNEADYLWSETWRWAIYRSCRTNPLVSALAVPGAYPTGLAVSQAPRPTQTTKTAKGNPGVLSSARRGQRRLSHRVIEEPPAGSGGFSVRVNNERGCPGTPWALFNRKILLDQLSRYAEVGGF